MPSTPLTCSSIGWPTVAASVSALEPGKLAVTEIVGGTIGGYCAIGSVTRQPRPTMTTDNTHAKTGWSTKKRDSMGLTGFVGQGKSSGHCGCERTENRRQRTER